MSNNLKIFLVGTGPMAIDYSKVLNSLTANYVAIGRSTDSCKDFFNATNILPVSGGIENYISSNNEIPSHAIVAVGILELKNVTLNLIESGVKNILIEKPGGLNENQLNQIHRSANKKGAKIYIAYNRRFYSATKKVIEIINNENGALSFNFEFTEWIHLIESLNIPNDILQNYFLANSSHVVDLAFYVGGKPNELSHYVSGGLAWHKSASIFAGSGITETGALFSYQANWGSPGRWSLEFLTKKYRLILKPMEKLQIQKLNSIDIEFYNDIDYSIDERFKPGLYKQVECFLYESENLKEQTLCSIKEQILNYKNIYKKIANYQ